MDLHAGARVTARADLIRLGQQLSDEDEAAADLWTWLPSHAVAEKHHGDYAIEHRPSLRDILVEAAMYLGHLKVCTPLTPAEVEQFETCPCGGDHPGDPPKQSDASLRKIAVLRAERPHDGRRVALRSRLTGWTRTGAIGVCLHLATDEHSMVIRIEHDFENHWPVGSEILAEFDDDTHSSHHNFFEEILSCAEDTL